MGMLFLFTDPFDYYFLYFSVLNWMGSPGDTSLYLIGWGSLADTVYINLLDEYLLYFFPCTGDTVMPVKCRGDGRPKDTKFVGKNSFSGYVLRVKAILLF